MKFIDGDYYESLADFSFGDMYSSNITHPNYQIISEVFSKVDSPTFFIETHRLPILLRELKNFENKCQIIAHNSDQTFGQEILSIIPPNVKRIWCQNYNYFETDIIKSLPIGLERKRWVPELKKQEVLVDIMNQTIDRDKMVYMNFNTKTSPIRQSIYDQLKDKDFITNEMIGWWGGEYENYLLNLKRHKYVISPPGGGIDCHRNWEAIYCGCIPIVLESNFVHNVFGDSVISVVDYSVIDYDYLNSFETKTNFVDINSKYIKLDL